MNKLAEARIEMVRAAVASPATASIAADYVKTLLHEFDQLTLELEGLRGPGVWFPDGSLPGTESEKK